jgi:hypothetical protein
MVAGHGSGLEAMFIVEGRRGWQGINTREVLTWGWLWVRLDMAAGADREIAAFDHIPIEGAC